VCSSPAAFCTQHNPQARAACALGLAAAKGAAGVRRVCLYKAADTSPSRGGRLPSPSPTVMSRLNLLPAAHIESLVLDGRPIVIHEGHALDLGEWINRHPGGRLAILHMVGRDATDEINM